MYTRRVIGVHNGTMHYATSTTRYVQEPESFTTPEYNTERKVVPKPVSTAPKSVPVTKEEYDARMKETMERYTKRMKELAKNKRGTKVIGYTPR